MKLIAQQAKIITTNDIVVANSSSDIVVPSKGSSFSEIEESWDFSDVLEELLKKYRLRGSPVQVNFRELVPFHSGIDRATHLFHTYPAKLLVNIPLFFLRCEQIGSVGHLRDPFCGSGTVLLEGVLRGWRVSGADSNPLARLVTRTKLTHVDGDLILDACARVCEEWERVAKSFTPVVDVDYWFTKTVQSQLGSLIAAIDQVSNQNLRQFFRVCVSSCVRKASFADPRLSVPVRVSPGSMQWVLAQNANVVELFQRAVAKNARRLEAFRNVHTGGNSGVRLSVDARNVGLTLPPREDVDLIITSPPYIGAQKYVRASSLNIGWLGLAARNKLRPLEESSIGREHYRVCEYAQPCFPENGMALKQLEKIRKTNPLRAHIAGNYLVEMRDALLEMTQRLRPGGTLILVIGNNTVVGEEFPTSQYVAEIVKSLGLDLKLELVDHIRSRGLMTKRNKTAGIITQEHIQMFTKA